MLPESAREVDLDWKKVVIRETIWTLFSKASIHSGLKVSRYRLDNLGSMKHSSSILTTFLRISNTSMYLKCSDVAADDSGLLGIPSFQENVPIERTLRILIINPSYSDSLVPGIHGWLGAKFGCALFFHESHIYTYPTNLS